MTSRIGRTRRLGRDVASAPPYFLLPIFRSGRSYNFNANPTERRRSWVNLLPFPKSPP